MLHKLALLCSRKPWLILGLAALMSALSWFGARSMHVDATFMGIVNENDPDAVHFRDVSTSFGGSGNLILLVDCQNLAQGQAFLKELAPKLLELDEWVQGVDAQFDLSLDALPKDVVPLPLPVLERLEALCREQPERAKTLLTNPGLATLLEVTEQELSQSNATMQPVNDETLQIFDQALNQVESLLTAKQTLTAAQFDQQLLRIYQQQEGRQGAPNISRAKKLSWQEKYMRDGWVASPDGRCLLATVRMKIDVLDTALGVDCFGNIDQRTQELADKYPGLKAGFAGAPAYGYEDQQSVLLRTRWLSGLSLVMVLMLFFFIDRSVFGPFIVGIPLMLGTLWTFGLVKVFIGYVSITSAVFGILLFGLGVDFAIHIVVRYNDARALGKDHEAALIESMVLTGRGVVTGALTTATAFFGMLVTDQKAARHLGITTGFGLLCCLVAMITVLPALLTLTKGRKKNKPGPEDSENTDSDQSASMNIKSLSMWVDWVTRHPVLVLVVIHVLVLLSLIPLPQARIEYDIEKIATKGAKAMVIKRRVKELFELSVDYALCVCKDLEHARVVTRELRQDIPSVARVESISDAIPEGHEQLSARLQSLSGVLKSQLGEAWRPEDKGRFERADLIRLARILSLFKVYAGFQSQKPQAPAHWQSRLLRVDRVLKILSQNQADHLQRLKLFDQRLRQRLLRFLGPLQQGRGRPLEVKDLPPLLRDKFIDKRGRFVVLAYPRQSMLDAQAISGFFDDVAKVNDTATGVGKIVYLFVAKSLNDLPLLLVTVAVLVLFVVGLDFQSLRWAILVFVPLIYASILAVGLVLWTGQIISVLMLAGFPLILGIGIDDGIHLVHRVLENPDGHITDAVAQTGKAILMTSITTMMSFGGLLLMNHHGLEGLGFLVTVGVALCFLASITIFPVILSLIMNKAGTKPDTKLGTKTDKRSEA